LEKNTRKVKVTNRHPRRTYHRGNHSFPPKETTGPLELTDRQIWAIGTVWFLEVEEHDDAEELRNKAQELGVKGNIHNMKKETLKQKIQEIQEKEMEEKKEG